MINFHTANLRPMRSATSPAYQSQPPRHHEDAKKPNHMPNAQKQSNRSLRKSRSLLNRPAQSLVRILILSVAASLPAQIHGPSSLAHPSLLLYTAQIPA